MGNPANIYLLKVNHRNIRKKYEICSKLTILTPQRHQWRRSNVFLLNFSPFSSVPTVNFEQDVNWESIFTSHAPLERMYGNIFTWYFPILKCYFLDYRSYFMYDNINDIILDIVLWYYFQFQLHQTALTCSKSSALETPENGVKSMYKINNKEIRTTSVTSFWCLGC